jgi:hypothetical protein
MIRDRVLNKYHVMELMWVNIYREDNRIGDNGIRENGALPK